jgi:hypothetical protein
VGSRSFALVPAILATSTTVTPLARAFEMNVERRS